MPRSAKHTATEDQVRTLLQNWKEKDMSELTETLGVDPKTISSWVVRLKKTMKDQGMSNDEIKSHFPSKRTAKVNPFEKVVRDLLSPKPRRGRKPKGQAC